MNKLTTKQGDLKMITLDFFEGDFSPGECEQKAERCEKAGSYLRAARWWVTGSANSLGHGRSERYEIRAKECLAKFVQNGGVL